MRGLQIACVSEEFGTNSKIAQVWSFADGCQNAKLVWERPFAVWEHAGSMVGRYDEDTICLMSPTWGGLIQEGRLYLHQSWWVMVFPMACIILAVLGLNALGDGLRHRLDPVMRR